MPSEEEKAVADTLVDALGKFVKVQAKVPVEPEQKKVTPQQYFSLSLFCCNVIILYLTVNSLFTTFVKSPVWQLMGQLFPVALGSGFIVARSKELQEWLLIQAKKNWFLAGMLLATIIFGAVGYTQISHFEVPVKTVAGVTQFCAEEVDGIDDVVSAVERSEPMPNERCAGGKSQARGERYLRHLKLGKSYMVTVKGRQATLDRYYLASKVVLRSAFGLESGALRLETVTLSVNSDSPNKTIRIQTESSMVLIYVPEGCSIEENSPTVITCPLPNGIFPLQLMPARYRFVVEDGNCKVVQKQPLELKVDDQIEVKCR
jgi:hypothetical protein